jgi:hypothetical protein
MQRMLLTCVTNGWPIENYLDPAHPLQVAIKKELEALAGETNYADIHRWLWCSAISDFSSWIGARHSRHHNFNRACASICA